MSLLTTGVAQVHAGMARVCSAQPGASCAYLVLIKARGCALVWWQQNDMLAANLFGDA